VHNIPYIDLRVTTNLQFVVQFLRILCICAYRIVLLT